MTQMLIILGAMKCGTTSLFHYLSCHSAISPCTVKEPNFFTDAAQFKKGEQHYRKLWGADRLGVRYRMEASVSYTKGEPNVTILRRQKESGLSFKFLYIVRDPFERIESHYTHGISDQWEIAKSKELVSDHAIKTTMYFSHIDPYFAAFGASSVMVVDFSHLRKAPQETLDAIYAFLELPPLGQDTQSLSRHNASSEKRQFSSALMLAMQANYQLRFSRVIPKKLRRFILARTSKPVERYILNDEQKRYIAHRLADDYRKFSARFGCQTDCDNWTIKKWMHGAETSVGVVDSRIRSST